MYNVMPMIERKKCGQNQARRRRMPSREVSCVLTTRCVRYRMVWSAVVSLRIISGTTTYHRDVCAVGMLYGARILNLLRVGVCSHYHRGFRLCDCVRTSLHVCTSHDRVSITSILARVADLLVAQPCSGPPAALELADLHVDREKEERQERERAARERYVLFRNAVIAETTLQR
jgi:hypothetical protein